MTQINHLLLISKYYIYIYKIRESGNAIFNALKIKFSKARDIEQNVSGAGNTKKKDFMKNGK